MAKAPPEPREFIEILGTMEGGVNSYIPPLLLPLNTLSSGVNTTVRGDYVTQRSILRRCFLDDLSQSLLNSAVSAGQFQACCYFKPDFGREGIAMVAGGVLLSIIPDPNNYLATVSQITWDPTQAAPWNVATPYVAGNYVTYLFNGFQRIYRMQTASLTGGDPPPQNPVNWKPQNAPIGENWMWQSEMFVIWNDGATPPVFWNTNGQTARKSGWRPGIPTSTTITTAFTFGAPGSVKTGVVVGDTTAMKVGQQLNVGGPSGVTGAVIVANIPVADTTHVDLTNVNLPEGTGMQVNDTLSWQNLLSAELPPGRQGTYGLGRNWMVLTDGRQFIGSDAVGGSSGTQALAYRDAPLHTTENSYLAGGGTFIVPGAAGPISSMRFMATLDTSLGQGPLQVGTKTTMFSVNSPTDRLTWQDVQNPILTESIISNGSTGQDSTINVNGDLLFRALDGFRSMVLTRREWDTWGRTPISTEVSAILDADDQTLLNWGSAVVFDNRVIFTAKPTQIPQGIVHKTIIPLNLDPVSSLRGKQPTVYDSLQWTGLNVFKLVTGSFENRQRAFAICWNSTLGNVELYEVLPSANTSIWDNDITRITWAFNTASCFREPTRTFKRLTDGEIYVDELEGQVDFQAWFKPDQYPCFVPWIVWSECEVIPPPGQGHAPGFRPRMGLGTPPNKQCDPATHRILNFGYTFDFRFVITGKCRFLGARFRAVKAEEPEFAKPNCVNTVGLQTLQSVLPKPKPVPPTPTPPGPPSGLVVLGDSDGNFIVDADGNLILA